MTSLRLGHVIWFGIVAYFAIGLLLVRVLWMAELGRLPDDLPMARKDAIRRQRMKDHTTGNSAEFNFAAFAPLALVALLFWPLVIVGFVFEAPGRLPLFLMVLIGVRRPWRKVPPST